MKKQNKYSVIGLKAHQSLSEVGETLLSVSVKVAENRRGVNACHF